MNNFSFWRCGRGVLAAHPSLFMPGGGPAGLTLYPPLVLQTGDALRSRSSPIHSGGRSLDHGRDQHHRHHQ